MRRWMKRLSIVGLILIWTALIAWQAVRYGEQRIIARVPSPDNRYIAEVRSQWAIDPPSHSLWLYSERGGAPREIAHLGEDSEWCDQVIWSRDATKVAFLINGVHLDIYDVAVQQLLTRLPLVDVDGYPSSRVARKVRFTDVGAGVEFDDCLRSNNDCKARSLSFGQGPVG